MSDHPIPKPQPRRAKLSYGRLMLYSVIAGMVLGGLNGLAEALAGDYVNPIRIAGVAVVVVVIMFAALAWWRGADEAVREAHKWAWFWGGSCGMGVALLPFVIALWDPELVERWTTGIDASGLFLAGMAALIVPQMIGYGIAWAVWWLRRR